MGDGKLNLGPSLLLATEPPLQPLLPPFGTGSHYAALAGLELCRTDWPLNFIDHSK